MGESIRPVIGCDTLMSFKVKEIFDRKTNNPSYRYFGLTIIRNLDDDYAYAGIDFGDFNTQYPNIIWSYGGNAHVGIRKRSKKRSL